MQTHRWRRWLAFIGWFGVSISALSAPANIASDWQLPFVETEQIRAFADTSGTVIEYDDGASFRLHAGHRGFPPVHEPPYLYATGLDGQLTAWHLERREAVWSRQFEGWVFPPLFSEGALYLSGQPHRLFKLDARTGATLASTALPNEAIYSPVSWRSGRIGVGVYARYWLVLDANDLSEKERITPPQPPITASPDGTFLSHGGHLFQQRADGHFVRIHDGKSPVDWFRTTDGNLLWASGNRLLRFENQVLACLQAGAPIVHRQEGSDRDRITVTNFNGTSWTLQVSQYWGNPDLHYDKENNDEKMVSTHDVSTDRQYDQLRPC